MMTHASQPQRRERARWRRDGDEERIGGIGRGGVIYRCHDGKTFNAQAWVESVDNYPSRGAAKKAVEKWLAQHPAHPQKRKRDPR